MTAAPESSADPSSDDPMVGTVVDGKYRVDALLGEGGMGSVYRVQHLGLRRNLALKVLRPELTSHTEVAARFDREAQSAARLDHPNCLQVTDFGTTRDGLKYMVMQLLSGHELTDELDGRALPPERAVTLMLQIVRGLEHAHEHGIVHRDIKPENVLVTTDHDGQELLKLVDFGIAKVLEGELDGASPKLTRAGMVFGTPRYMSPEQAAGGDIDHRADLYSAGILFYEMLTGTLPFDSDDLVKVLRQQIIEPPPPLPDHVPAALRAIVERLLEKDKDDRLQSATAVIEALEAYQAFQPVPASPTPSGAPVPTLAPRGPTLAPLGPTLAPLGSTLAPLGPTLAPLPSPSVPPVGGSTMIPMHGHPTYAGHNAVSLPTMRPMAASTLRVRIAQRPRWQLVSAAVGGLLALVVTCSWIAGDDGEPGTAAVGTPSEVAWYDGLFSGSGDDGPDPDALTAIDDAIVANRVDEARTKLEALEEEHPEHPQLKWRRARLLAKANGQAEEALQAYAAVATQAPALLEEPAFFAELDRLLRQPKLQTTAVTVAIEQLGHAGHGFLLGRLNQLDDPLPWAERKRAAEAIEAHEPCAPLLDARRQIAADLLQASDSDDPCATFGGALMLMKLDLDQTYLQPVHDAKLPKACKEHKALLTEVRTALAQRHGQPKSKSSARCRGLKGMFRSGC
ncbi:serine/threonine-protein kinase [Paraliomyxa miuraensis]|uniref:serine/threonine-protein kinase n=1 Tax=Paraliomyxa miuraensis TaxID=376150 RepID=UPI00225490B5|nr:serine/threonine-protein kinase [Paraliomyxa miuraensis]MCX4245031.1 protein kinase [Paraliomyxa miuraensis]